MDQLRIIFIYIVSVLFLLTKMRQPYIHVDPTITGQMFSLFSILLLITQIRFIQKFRYSLLLFLYIILLFISLVFIQDNSYSILMSWVAPLIIAASLQDKDRKALKPLTYLFLLVFFANAFAAFYERFTLSLLMEPDVDDRILLQQMEIGESSDSSFRSFAFFGHPLNNGNIMAFMSFIILYSKTIPAKMRLILSAMGFSSLFCFNSRGAILVSVVLLTPIIYQYLKYEAKHKIAIVICIISFTLFLASNFSVFGGRLASSDIMDESAMVRVLSIQEFLNIPFNTLLVGGYEMTYGENGFLMILAQYGLIIGGFKIFVELFFSYKIIGQQYKKKTKFIIMASLIIIGSTNNNLAFPLVFPMYVMCVMIILNNNKKLAYR